MLPVVLNLPAASKQLTSESGCVLWHSTRETTGSASAVYQLWDGSNTAGPLLMTISLDQSESTRDFLPKHHMPFKVGLYFVLVSGALEGSVIVLLGCRCGEQHVHIDIPIEALG